MSTATVSADAIAPNAQRLLWAGFLAILAAGIGFGIRGGILATWAADFGFSPNTSAMDCVNFSCTAPFGPPWIALGSPQ